MVNINWNPKKPKVFVTGATGFIGSELIKQLLKFDCYVIATTRNNFSPDITDPRLQYIQLDLIDPTVNFKHYLFGINIVINCAGNLHNPATMKLLHVDATAKLLNEFIHQLKNDGQVGRWVQLSSVGAYGPVFPANTVRVVTEESQVAPVDQYETTKAIADAMVMQCAAENPSFLSYCILRPSNVCGRNMISGALRDWASVIKRNLFFFVGSKDAVSTYIHVQDVAEALVACAFHPGAKNQIFNISNDCKQVDLVRGLALSCKTSVPWLRIPEMLVRFIAKIFQPLPGFPLTMSRIDSLVSRTTYPSEKLFACIGFKPKIDIIEAVNEIIAEDV